MMKTAFKFAVLLFVLSHVASSQEIFDAIRDGDIVKGKELVEKDQQLIETRTAGQSTPLLVAVSVDNKSIAENLIEKGAELNAANLNQWTPLSYAQNVEFVKLLLENGQTSILEHPIIRPQFILFGMGILKQHANMPQSY